MMHGFSGSLQRTNRVPWSFVCRTAHRYQGGRVRLDGPPTRISSALGLKVQPYCCSWEVCAIVPASDSHQARVSIILSSDFTVDFLLNILA
jgi:hypothetical protein